MAHKGKMTSSPFHVESPMYKYAIEHENDNYKMSPDAVKCNQLYSAHNCRLWNSGLSKCAAFKCLYHQKNLRRSKATCAMCAHYYDKKCLHEKKPMREDLHTDTATYCCFYLCEADNKSKYYQVARYERRIYLTAQLEEQKKLITKRRKQIKEAEKEMSKVAPDSADYCFLKGKIENRSKYLLQAEKQFSEIQTMLDQIGGELRQDKKKK